VFAVSGNGSQLGAGLSTGTWYHLVFSRSGNSGTYSAYLNGSLKGTASSGTWSSSNTIAMGIRPGYGSQYFNGTLDEVRVSNAVRSADWISTEYHNQNSPSTFYSVGSSTTSASPAISSLSPNWGEIAEEVTITGTDFGSTQGSSTVGSSSIC
jgi:Concanavalin A-like lectin/glucanases superfamily/IPT/TIG domain